MSDRIRVLIVGHSFISRLDNAIGRYLPINFNLRQCVIQCFGVSGGRTDSLRANQGLRRKIVSFQPAILILQIGGNDLCEPLKRPESIACDIVELMESLQACSSVRVGLVCELFVRTRPRAISPQNYEEKRQLVNQMLPTLLQTSSHEHLLFWRHLRLMNSPLNILCEDRVHLSTIGNKKLYRSLRLAILHAIVLLI